MTVTHHLLAVVCVCVVAAGQVLFKYTALELRLAGSPWHASVLLPASLALLIYGAASLLWVALLQHVPLSRAYPYMALSFVIVAGAGWLLFREEMSGAYVAGLVLVVAGLIVLSQA